MINLKSRDFFKTEKKHIPFACMLILVILFLSFMHTYNDILITARQSMKFWDVLFAGRPLSFYKEAVMISGNEQYNILQNAAYPFSFYLVFAIWNFPIWIIETVFKTEVFNTPIVMFWQKIILIIFAFLSANEIYKIVTDFSGCKKKGEESILLFFTSLPLLAYTFSLGSYEIITVFFMLSGFNAWIKDNIKKFVVMFTIAFSFKYFSFICFFPLLLLKEKNIFKVGIKTVLSFIPTAILVLIFPKPEFSGSLTLNLLYKFYDYNLSIGNIFIPVYIFVMIIICLWCFISKPDEKMLMQYAVFAMIVSTGSFCVLADIFPYWSVLAVPFLILAVVFSNGNKNKMIVLETVFGLMLIVTNIIKYPHVLGVKTVYAVGLVPKLFGVDESLLCDLWNVCVLDILPLSSSLLQKICSWLGGFLILVWGVMLYFCFPGRKSYEVFEEKNRGILVLRIIVNILFAVIPFVYASTYLIMNFVK